MKRAALAVLLGLSGLGLTACGGTAKVTGTVFESGTLTKVAGATVSLSPANKSAITDTLGSFTIDKVERKNQTITVIASGYTTFTDTVLISGGLFTGTKEVSTTIFLVKIKPNTTSGSNWINTWGTNTEVHFNFAAGGGSLSSGGDIILLNINPSGSLRVPTGGGIQSLGVGTLSSVTSVPSSGYVSATSASPFVVVIGSNYAVLTTGGFYAVFHVDGLNGNIAGLASPAHSIEFSWKYNLSGTTAFASGHLKTSLVSGE